jgi:polygalacturonase
MLSLALALALGVPFHNVRDYGAKGDGVAKDTAAVQAALEAAAKEGGGTVLVPAGRYLCGTLHLRSSVTLQVAAGATLAMSPDHADFDPYEKLAYDSHADAETTYFHYALLAGEDLHDVAILGQGTIDGNRSQRGGPKPIALKRCQRVAIRGVTVKNAPNYSISFLGCDWVDVDGVTILNGYSDGIDPDSSRYVRISNCFIDSWDDAICPKASLALGAPRSTEHVTVTNCVLSTSCNNIKLGTESSGDFKNLAFSNCAMFRRPGARRPISGISMESVDGSHIDGIVVSNITMQDVDTPVFIRLGNRGRGLDPPVPGSLANVSISNLVATGALRTCPIAGLPGHPVRRVSLSDLNLTFQGGEQKAGGLEAPEHPAKYPEATMFGVLPAYGVWARHVEGLTLRNVRLRWEQADARPPMLFDDVADLAVDSFTTGTPGSASPAARK